MRSFFVQIFLSFWVSSLAIFVAAALLFPSPEHPDYGNLQIAFRGLLQRQVALQVAGRPTSPCSDTNEYKLYVIDARGTDLCGRTPDQKVVALATRVQLTGKSQYAKLGSLWAAAQELNQNGRQLVAVFLTPYQSPGWLPHFPPFTIPVSALVTFVFAYFLTNPVRKLRLAFRRFAAGDMSVRLPVARSALRDWGGADIRTLMIDFNEMADRIQALLEAHKTLLRDVSHELRSPLARLNVALELAREEAGEANHALDRAELESGRLNALIGELLSLSLMESIHDVPNPKPVQLTEIVAMLMPDLQFEADSRGCRVIHSGSDGCAVIGSEDLLRRAVENVIRNAIRYSPSGADVTLETSTQSADAGLKAVLRVCDAGPGVPEESLQSIFRPFYRVDSARQSSTGGFGVGLAIAQRAVQLHGGTIRAFNRPGGGLCVEFRLPCA